MVTPVFVERLEQLLKESQYDQWKTEYLVDGFRNGFSLGYAGRTDIKMESENLKFHIGNKTELWNKVMKEVKEKRYAGPFPSIPFEHYIQSPIGLVPKNGGLKTRLIFHLSHPREENSGSVNANTPKDKCKVKYSDFDEAIHALNV